jgi:hypothetical protein
MARGIKRQRGDGEEPPAQRPAVAFRVLRVESLFRRDTRNLHRQERDRFSNFLWNMLRLDRGPRVTLTELVGEEQNTPLDYDSEGAINASVNYYHDKADHTDLLQVLKFFCAYLMQQARKEPNADKQIFLAFKVVDLARMMVQYSPFAVNAEAETLVLGVFVDLATHEPARYKEYATHQQTVFTLMKRLQLLPNDLHLRYQLAEALVAQTSFIDALVQYQTLLRLYPRRSPSSDRIHGRTYGRIGGIFQNLAEHATPSLRDARKLKNFISRFNRDFADRRNELPAFDRPDARLARVRRALLAEAIRWFVRAAEVSALDRRLRLQFASLAGQSQLLLDEPRDALRLLEQTYPLWQRVREGPVMLENKATFLRLLSSAALAAKQRDRAGWANRELNEVLTKLGTIEKEEREREQRRAAMLS